jgi:hypothetical protein
MREAKSATAERAADRAQNRPPEEKTMRKLIFAVAATAILSASGMLMSGSADAAVTGPSQAIRAAVSDVDTMQDVQFRFEGKRHCWASRGWNGPGWYQCGYQARRGRDWGGGEGWNGWSRHR